MLRNKKVVIIIVMVLVVVGLATVAFFSMFSIVHGYRSPDDLLAKSHIGEDVYFNPKYPYYSCTTNSSSPIQCTWSSIDDPNIKVLMQFPDTMRPVPEISSASYVRAQVLSKQGKTIIVLVKSVTDNLS